MVRFKQKEYSKLLSGLKGAKTGGIIGGLLIPGNVLLALFGKQKAALILTAIGAGVGVGIGFYWGWKGEKRREDYQKNLDPEKEKQKLQIHIRESLKYPSGSPITKKDLDSSPIQYKPDAYHYLEVYDRFSKKYRNLWIKAWENLDTLQDIDMDFEIVFPEPYAEEEYFEDYIVANGYAPSDHYFIMWDNFKKEYNNDLGSGKGKGKTLLEASQNFAAQWISPVDKISRPEIRKVAEIHNKIIQEFLKLK